nr:uncharacterized protein F13E9.13, mitochondrial-like [Rhipicephalus microplus]
MTYIDWWCSPLCPMTQMNVWSQTGICRYLRNGFQFVRAEGFVVGHVADEGIMECCASELLRYRRIIDAEDILVFADKEKHWSAAITSDVSILETMKAAEFFQCDGIILTGGATGLPPSTTELQGVHL